MKYKVILMDGREFIQDFVLTLDNGDETSTNVFLIVKAVESEVDSSDEALPVEVMLPADEELHGGDGE